MSSDETILEVRNLEKYFFSGEKHRDRGPRAVKALDGVSFSVGYGETLGVVGEPDCDKPTLGRAILRLYEPTEGQAVYRGKNLAEYGREEIRQMRREPQIIFQDPYSSLNPRMTIKELTYAPLNAFAVGSEEEKEARAIEIMDKVGLPLEFINYYPHELSGGQRQRTIIARALVLNPRFIVCGEPASALGVSVRAQVLSLMMGLRKELDLIHLFISHDLSVMRYTCDRIMVMYLGNIMEVTGKETLYEDAKHSYTQALLSAIPVPDMNIGYNRIRLRGDMPSPFNPPQGCRFHIRCQYATEKCRVQVPELKDVGDRHFVACHLYDE